MSIKEHKEWTDSVHQPEPTTDLWLQYIGNGLWQRKFDGVGRHFREVSQGPKPATGEWTAGNRGGETFLIAPTGDPDDIYRVDHPDQLAKSINAALAAERGKLLEQDRRHITKAHHEIMLQKNISAATQVELDGADKVIQQLREELKAACKVSQDSQRALWNATKQLAAAQAAQQPLVELLKQVLQETVNTPIYPDGPCLNKETRDDIKDALAKVKKGK